MHRVLKSTGSIYLQMDPRINHWMRILMDDVFGYENFRNEICWKYDRWSNVSKCFQRNHDVILFYSFKGAVFNELREPIEKPRKRNLVEIIDGKKVSKRVNGDRSEEHTSELQSRGHLVCRLLLEKKNN